MDGKTSMVINFINDGSWEILSNLTDVKALTELLLYWLLTLKVILL